MWSIHDNRQTLDIEQIKIRDRDYWIQRIRDNDIVCEKPPCMWLGVDVLNDAVLVDINRISVNEEAYIAEGKGEKEILQEFNARFDIIDQEIRTEVEATELQDILHKIISKSHTGYNSNGWRDFAIIDPDDCEDIEKYKHWHSDGLYSRYFGIFASYWKKGDTFTVGYYEEKEDSEGNIINGVYDEFHERARIAVRSNLINYGRRKLADEILGKLKRSWIMLRRIYDPKNTAGSAIMPEILEKERS